MREPRMAKIDNLELLIQANNEQLIAELRESRKALKEFGKETDNASKKSKGFELSAKNIKKALAAAGIMVAARAMASFAKAVTTSAMDAIESESLVGVTFGEMTGEIVTWSDQLEKALGMNAYATRKAAGTFFNVANSMGLGSDSALTLSKNLTLLANDMASFYNITTDDALLKLQSGITGETEPLKRLGIVVNETTIKQTALNEGMITGNQVMTEAQKVAARYITILGQTSNAQGDMARTLESPANQLRVLQSQIEGVKIALGAVFIPILNAVLPYIMAFVMWVGRAAEAVARFLGIAGVKVDVAAWANQTSQNLGGVGTAADNAAGGVKNLKKELANLAGFDEMNVLTEPTTAGGAAGAGGVSGGGAGFDMALPEISMDWMDEMLEKGSLVTEEMSNIFKIMGSVILGVFAGIATANILLWAGLAAPVAIAWGLIAAIFIGGIAYIALNWETLVENLKYMWDNWTKFWDRAIEKGTEIFRGAMKVIGTIFLTLGKFIYDIVNGIGRAFTWVMLKIGEAVYNAVEWIKKKFIILKNGLAEIGSRIKDAFNQAWEGVKKSAGEAIDWMKEKWAGFTGIVGGIGDAIWLAMKRGLNKAIDYINAFLGGLNRGILSGTGLKIAGIPHLATGGVIKEDTLAMLHKSSDEAVLPLNGNTEWIDRLAGKLNAQGGGGEPINLTVKIGSKTVGKEVIDYINNESIRSGSLVLNI